MDHRKRILQIVAYIWLIAFPVHVFAAVPALGDITEAILSVLSSIVPALTAVAVIFFLWTVAVFVRSADNDEQRQKSKSAMVAGIIGLVVMFSLWGIINTLGTMFGVKGENSSDIEDEDFNFEEFIVDTPYN